MRCPRCGSDQVFSWTGVVRTLDITKSPEDVGASIECGVCGFNIQGDPGQRLCHVTPRWMNLMKLMEERIG